ncbi:MoxR-like ATPase [Micromonospora vinacea]|uniref:MoxR-like ATPase n=1 Tax=Micromonospora vinacea TaxID=709878 RepID=A0ABS0K5M0_9ACTN|nr:AAA family ATPase [Micromonospora vinacea]MBG6103860.1 MoxR-like ATPase [Micromonospora vinacea]
MISMQPAPLSTDAVVLREAIARARSGLVDREVVAEVVVLCAVAGEHVLVIGAPGTAKSEAVRRTADQLGGRYFEYLLGRFTEPNEIFGPVNLRRLREGSVEFETSGMLPEAEVAFLDEVFLGSTAVLNTLLGILNERVFRRGSTVLSCPLRVCVGAANSLPDDPALAAFADRFLARVFVSPVPDVRLDELLEVGWSANSRPSDPAGSLLPALDRLSQAARECDLKGVRGLLASAIRQLRQAGVPLSDRRVVRSQRLVAAAATLDGRSAATADDLWVLALIAPTLDAQATAREALSNLVAQGRNASLVYAAEEFARGQQARAARLVEAGRRLLDELGTGPLTHDGRLRYEATLREIDAGFVRADAPQALQDMRGLLVTAIQR